jgi:hypothetical protein
MRRIGRYQLVGDVATATLFVLFFALVVGSEGALVLVAVLCFGVALAIRRLSPPLALGVAWVAALAQMATYRSVLLTQFGGEDVDGVLAVTVGVFSALIGFSGVIAAVGMVNNLSP